MKSTKKPDFRAALQAVGITPGMAAMVHSCVKPFGMKPADIAECLGELITEAGCLLFPRFTFGCYDGELFDPATTPGTTGVLGEYVATLPNSTRTLHPSASWQVWSASGAAVGVGPDAFGGDCVYSWMASCGGRVVCIGVPFRDCATFVHHVEQMHGVPYRFFKTFTCTVRRWDGVEPMPVTQYVRKPGVVTDFSRLEKRLLADGLMQETKVGAGVIQRVSCEDVYRVTWDMLDADPYCLTTEGKR